MQKKKTQNKTKQNKTKQKHTQKKSNFQGDRTRLPKFKFSANFPIGLHVILQLQIKKFKNA